MDKINGAVRWYQKKIGAYDKQVWERSVEQSVLKSISNVPKKPANVKPELIDVDLVRGSTFTKAKPLHSAFAVARKGLVRVIFLPLFYSYWIKQTSRWMCGLLFTLYVMQVITMSVYITDANGFLNKETLSLAHLLSPLALMLALGLTHSQIVATHVSSKHRQERHQKKREAKVCRKNMLQKYEKGDTDKSGTTPGISNHDNASGTVRSRKNKSYHRRKASSGGESAAGRLNKKSAQLNYFPDADDEGEGTRTNDLKVQDSVSRNYKSDQLAQNGVRGSKLRKDQSYEYISYRCEEGEAQAYSADTAEALARPLSDVTGEMQAAAPYDQEHFHVAMRDGGDSPPDMAPCGELLPDLDEIPRPLPPPTGAQHPRAEPEDQHSDSGLNSIGEEADISQNAAELPAAAGDDRRVEVVSGDIESSPSRSASGHPGPAPAAFCDEPEVARRRAEKDNSGNSTPEKHEKRSKMLSFLEERSKSKLEKVAAPETSSCDSEADTSKTPPSPKHGTSEADWDDTVNTEITSCSDSDILCSSETEISGKDDQNDASTDEHVNIGIHGVNSVMNNLASSTDKVSCMIFENVQVQKVDLNVMDIGWCIIKKVEQIPETCDYLVMGIVFSSLLMLSPVFFRLYHAKDQIAELDLYKLGDIETFLQTAVGENWRQVVLILNGSIQRFCLSLLFFFLLSVAERTFKLRLLYAKHFCYLTSSRRAKKYELPHFRLNKVRNIKTWLSLRSYLKKRGPQRSVDIIVSAAFLMAIFLVSVMCFELLQDFGRFLDHLGNLELVLWCMALSVYLLRFMTLGTKINKKYRNFSVLITEQINLYLHMEQKPHKKEELMLANSVLKLAEDLLKELESPFKISGLAANPFLYNITKVVILSAFSAVLTELLGFKLKLYKIKLRG